MARCGLEHKLQFLCTASTHGDFLYGFTKFFVPCLDRIIARRKVLQLEIARLVRHRKEGMLEDGDIAAHPRMNIALQGDGDLFASEGGVYTGARGLGLIPFAIVAGCGMYVMCRSVIIHNVELLIRTQPAHIQLATGREMEQRERNVIRADYVRKLLDDNAADAVNPN